MIYPDFDWVEKHTKYRIWVEQHPDYYNKEKPIEAGYYCKRETRLNQNNYYTDSKLLTADVFDKEEALQITRMLIGYVKFHCEPPITVTY